MTAAEAKQMLIDSFINIEDPNQFEARLNVFIDIACKEQCGKCLKEYIINGGKHFTEIGSAIGNAPKPDGL